MFGGGLRVVSARSWLTLDDLALAVGNGPVRRPTELRFWVEDRQAPSGGSLALGRGSPWPLEVPCIVGNRPSEASLLHESTSAAGADEVASAGVNSRRPGLDAAPDEAGPAEQQRVGVQGPQHLWAVDGREVGDPGG